MRAYKPTRGNVVGMSIAMIPVLAVSNSYHLVSVPPKMLDLITVYMM